MYVIDYKISSRLFEVRDHLLRLYLDHLRDNFVSVTKNKEYLASKALSCILLNVNLMGHRNKIHITLDRSQYSKGGLMNGQHIKRRVSYDYTRSVLDFLVLNEYIRLEVGGVHNNDTQWGFVNRKWLAIEFANSYMIILPKLSSLMPEYVPELLTDVIRLKNADKKLITFKPPEHIKDTMKFQKSYNKFSLDNEVMVGDKRYYVQAYRVYNTSFNRGGRGFMNGRDNVQSLSKEKRRGVHINGMSCMCFDYVGFEPTLLYTMAQEVMPFDDPYLVCIPEYDQTLLRKIGKGFFLRMLNCNTKEEAYKACREFIKDEVNVQLCYDKNKIPEPRIDVKGIMEMLEHLHYLVKDKLYGGFGSELQYAGSLINDYLLDYFMQRGILVIQVHDAFIVEKEHESALEQCMKRAFEDVLGFSDNVKISKEF